MRKYPPSARLVQSIGVLSLLAFVMGATGCSSKSYVDPGLPVVEYTSLASPATPGPLSLSVEFQSFGRRSGPVTTQLAAKSRAILKRSGLFSSIATVPSDGKPHMKIVVNNTGDVGAATGKGFATGLTFGLVGSMVTDKYDFTGTYRQPGHEDIVKGYRGAIHSTVGLKAGPKGVEAMSTGRAFDVLVERLILNWLQYLRQKRAI